MATRFEIELTEDECKLLGCIGDPKEVIERAIHSVVDGIGRPGAWERGVVIQMFGDDFESRLSPDPQALWRQRPAVTA